MSRTQKKPRPPVSPYRYIRGLQGIDLADRISVFPRRRELIMDLEIDIAEAIQLTDGLVNQCLLIGLKRLAAFLIAEVKELRIEISRRIR